MYVNSVTERLGITSDRQPMVVVADDRAITKPTYSESLTGTAKTFRNRPLTETALDCSITSSTTTITQPITQCTDLNDDYLSSLKNGTSKYSIESTILKLLNEQIPGCNQLNTVGKEHCELLKTETPSDGVVRKTVSLSKLDLDIGMPPATKPVGDSWSKMTRKKKYSESRAAKMFKSPRAVPLNNQKGAPPKRQNENKTVVSTSPVRVIKNDLSSAGGVDATAKDLQQGVDVDGQGCVVDGVFHPYIVRYTTGQSLYMYRSGNECNNNCLSCKGCTGNGTPTRSTNSPPYSQLLNNQVYGNNLPASHVPHPQFQHFKYPAVCGCLKCQYQQQQQTKALILESANQQLIRNASQQGVLNTPLKYCFKITTLLPSNNNQVKPPHIYLDLTGRNDIKTSIAFSEQDKADNETTKLNENDSSIDQLPSEVAKSFVGIKPPICVPRSRDHLGTWRTCMVPAWDLEKFAFMTPPTRRWKVVSSPSPSNVLLFTLLCYNILSDQYATRQSYWHCQTWALSWAYRRRGILEDIISRSPSIVCLQEVETEQFYTFFLPQLNQEGYDGIFSAKSRAKTMNEAQKKRVDGCAILWKRNKFRLVAEHVIEFSRTYLNSYWNSEERKSTPSSEELLNRVMTRDNIALAAVLEPKSSKPGNGFMVSTAHIHWDPQFSDVKLIQTITLTSALKDKMLEYQQIYKMKDGSVPLILCGDFNSLPESGVTQFLTSGRIDKQHPEFKKLGHDPSLNQLSSSLQSHELSHSFDLRSCYADKNVFLKYSNYTKDFKGVIDYVFISKQHFKMLGCLEGIPCNWYAKEKVVGCPQPFVSSDHIPLLVELELAQKRPVH